MQKIWGYPLLPMFPNVIKEGAFFVADAHVNEKRDELYYFLEQIRNSTLNPSQLFLMGDIFDLLVGGVKYTQKTNQKYIDLINEISKKTETFYFEGNHDFNLKKLFSKVKVFSYNEQPVLFDMNDKKVLLLHGDKAAPFSYVLYTSIIRSKLFLSFVSLFDNISNGFISKKIISSQYDKKLCKHIDNFKSIVLKRVEKLTNKDIKVILEGHFHQDIQINLKKEKKYINIPSFACNKSFIIVQSHLSFIKEQFAL